MNIISKKKQGVIAIICAIAMIVTSLTIYNPREVKADTEYKDLKYTQVGDKDYWVAAGNDDFPFQMVQDQGDQFLIIPQVAAGTKPIWPNFTNVTLNDESFNQAPGAGIYIKYADLKNNTYNVFQATSAVDGHTFRIIIKAGNPSSGGEESSEVERPAAPTNLAIAFNEENKTCKISFDEVDGITTYNFYVGGRKIGVVPENKTFSISELNVEEGKEYTFGVTSVNTENIESIKATTKYTVPVLSAPAAPTSLVANINNLKTDYTIAFANVPGATSYKFYLNGKYIKDISNGGIVTFEELGLEPETEYTFGVKAVNSKGESEMSTIKVTTPVIKADEVPAAPQGLVFELNDSKTGYLIKFAPIPRATSYKFYVDGTFKKEVAASGETITIDELGIELGKTYKFGVSAVNSNGESTVSELEVQVPAIEYAITLDGKKIKDISYGNTYKLSNNEQGYYDVDKNVAYAPETVITVKSDMNLKSISLNVAMQNGASIRFKNPTGLRFQTKITSNNDLSLDGILNNGTVIKTGTIITTSTILGENGVVNDKFVEDNSKLKLNITNSGWYENTVGTFCGSIVSIAESNYTTDFVGVGYVTITYSDKTHKTIYASSNNIRSVATVAQNIINDKTKKYEGKTYYEYLQAKGLSAIVDEYAGVANKDNQ
ncbi:fibronectin type III domain-containing protein [Eubacterium sp. CAG:156]|uniref:fibronectin type III domain-containing protein n=1 Tax=Eubacterium sp. CAG:156 TaxID=1262880 RepID=UPI0003389BAD|nr:uncharacterized protein BN504_02071 [Eubacterium sp. CAG:156]